MQKPKKILILGSGALKIAQAGEFDYSGSQAIKAFKEEGIKTVLINPNIATIQTSEFLADEVYFLPVDDYFVEEIIKKEKPDAIALSFGGQTALNCGVSLEQKGILKKYGIRVLGTPVAVIDLTEDRQKFADHLHSIGLFTPVSKAANTLEESIEVANEIGYPVMVRAAFTLGGQKSGVAFTQKELEKRVKGALAFAPQVLVEKYLHHYKEIEYEVVRDTYDNCVTVCNMENMDPLGIHTGESIVVAPSQTLSNHEYHYLREVSIKLVRSLGLVGECNVQFALNPNPKNGKLEYYIIEMNARLSRSSALASKATGYPLAYVAAKLALGYGLTEIQNQVTKVTQSCFEPALDYLVVKVPRWDLEKFKGVEEQLGSSMKSVGEVMAIGRTFEETIQKALRMLDIGVEGVTDYERLSSKFNAIQETIKTLPTESKDRKKRKETLKTLLTATPKRIFVLAALMTHGVSVQEIYETCGIDPWFLYRIENIVKTTNSISKKDITDNEKASEKIRSWKQLGISDKRISSKLGITELEFRAIRKKHGVVPAVFQIDTMAGEFPAQTNYLYMTYNGNHYDIESLGKEGVIVLGSGPYRIGSSVEFDWTCVNTAMSLQKYGKKSIIINCNPETVSTDYDMSERLYFEQLTFERVADIYEFENPDGVIISVGGQTPNNLAPKLDAYGVNVLGTSPKDIDRAEDRSKFSQLLDDLGIPQPAWNKFTSVKQAIAFAEKVGYPVLIRPSYVLSGAAMSVCYTEEELLRFIQRAVEISVEYPLTVSKFFQQSKEIEMDGVAQDGEIMIHAISEHIEHAGVHSGDATIAFPAQRVFTLTVRKMKDVATQLVKALNITGPFNIQFLAKENKIFVIEMNVRASRTFPLISKASHVNFANAIIDAIYRKAKPQTVPYPNGVLVKVPQFSFSRLEGADPILRVEMASTGEVACFGDTVQEALYKSILATGVEFKDKSVLLSIGGIVNKNLFFDSMRLLDESGYTIYATRKTHQFLKSRGIKSAMVNKIYKKLSNTPLDLINEKKVSLVINMSDTTEITKHHGEHLTDGYRIRRAAIDKNIPLITNLQSAKFLVEALCTLKKEDLSIKAWSEYK